MSTKKKRPHHYMVQDEYFHKAKKLGYRARSAFKLLEIQEEYGFLKPGMKVFDLASFPGSFLQVIAKEVGETGFVVGMDIQPIKPLGRANVRVFQGDVFNTDTVSESVTEAFRRFEERRLSNLEKAENATKDGNEDSSETESEIKTEDKVGGGKYAATKPADAAVKPVFEAPPPVFDVITSDVAPNTTGMSGVDQYRSIELNIAILDIAERFLKKDGVLMLKVFVGEDVDELVGPIKARYAKLQRIKPKACRDRSFEEYFMCIGKKSGTA